MTKRITVTFSTKNKNKMKMSKGDENAGQSHKAVPLHHLSTSTL